MTKALTTRSNWQQPTTFKEASDLASYYAHKGGQAIPRAYQNSPGEALVAIAVGEGYGLSPIQSLQNLWVIYGKVGMDATLIRAKMMEHPSCEYAIVTEATPEQASIKVRRKEWPEGEDAVVTVTIEEAKKAKWGQKGGSWSADSSWVKTPADMLTARATSRAGRRYFPEVFSGVYDTAEIRDIVEVEAVVVPDKEEQDVAVGKLAVEDIKPVSAEEVPEEPVSLKTALETALPEAPHETSDDAAEAPSAPLIQNPALDKLEQELESLQTTKELRDRLTELLPNVDWGSEKPHRLIPVALRMLSEGEPVEEPEPAVEPDPVPEPEPPGEIVLPEKPDPEDLPPGVLMSDSIELRDLLLDYIKASTSTADLDRVTKDLNVSKKGLWEPHLKKVRHEWTKKREELKS